MGGHWDQTAGGTWLVTSEELQQGNAHWDWMAETSPHEGIASITVFLLNKLMHIYIIFLLFYR